VTLKMPAFEWVHVQLHQQKGMISLSPPTICNSAAAGTWHAVLSLDTGGIIFEVKHGGYQPVAADDYAHWAPAEGEPGTTELMAWYAQAQVGDSTFAV
ncbi:hypothetical protein, partial [Klebsiella pneumoniae]|uniref:hypothetical protein n=1 Tax=Klebsiella pneumoniae TaxID=573 RepID=UPI0040475DE5